MPAETPLRLLCLSTDETISRELISALEPFGDSVEVSATDPAAPDPEAVEAAHAIVCGSLSETVRSAAKNLRWVQFWSAGVDGKLTPQLFADGVQVTTGSGIHASSASEHVLSLMLAFARGLPLAFAAQQERNWAANAEIRRTMFELDGKTVGIIGAGAIGQALGKRCQAFGMRTIGIRKDASRTADGIDIMLPLLRYHEALLASDFIVLALPLTPETRMIFGEDEIEILKRTAYVFNIGRGGLVDQRWLTRALQNRWIAGAGLDVFEDEPLPVDSPLWSLPNCIITPHVGGHTPHYWERLGRLVARQVRLYRDGKPLENVVTPERGY